MKNAAEQFTATQQANLDVFAGLSQKAFAGFEKLVELNLAAGKALMAESLANLQALGGAKDPQAFVKLQSGLAQPLAEKSAAYSRHVYEIVSGTGAEFTKAFESKAAESQKAVTTFVESSLKNAPAGSEAAVALFKSTLEASNTAMESAQKAAKQAAQAVESNLNAVSAAAVKAA
ncbi:phasin family protein [Polaromonas sp.]|uniref:phasin family protein n=1 Tax=Polaromonas sp. TaxID=1869339 RepID=UPI001DA61C6E|nr:phasin family protein [Polaromonas sp.]MBT9477366.1 phasin family protein [Polaromonas sp.]